MLTFTNQAALSYRNRVRYSNLTTGQIADTLTVAKEALTGTYGPGGDVTYVVRLANNGTAPLTDLTLTDDLGGYAFGGGTVYPLSYVADSLRLYVNGALQPAPTVVAGPPLVVSGVTVPAGGNAMVVYEAAVTEYAAPGADGTVTNTVTATGAGLAAPVTAAATVSAQSGPELAIAKALSPETVGADRQVTYTFTRQGPVPRDRGGGSAGDLHLHHREPGQRRHRPGGQRDRHGYLRPGPVQHHGHAERGAPRSGGELHL